MRRPTVFSSALLAAVVLLAAERAGAQTCLDAATSLADQRDLRALAAAIDVNCPCDAYTGAPGFRRGNYLACAKQVRRNAVFLGDLREECVPEANRAIRGRTCGTEKVACGRFKPSARKPVSCRVKPVHRCSDKPKFSETACDATSCADVVEWTAATCLDPRVPGPYGAGARVVSWTKPSANDPNVDRTLDTVLWYPTADAGTPNPTYNAILNASVDASGGPYPVVLFSHGSCGFPLQSIFLSSLLASHGFIVVAPPHPGNTLSEFPTCGTIQAQVAAAVERPQDMIFVLDQILAADLDPGSDFFGSVDETRVAMTGHSFGGLTTYLVQPIEPRITAAIPMAAATGGTVELSVPSLTMLGQIDSVVSNAGIRGAYERSASPKWLVEIRDAGHYAFSNGCFPSPDCNPPTTLDQAEAHDAVLRWVVPFLHVTLRGDDAWAPLLEAPPSPTFVVASEP